MSDLIRSGERSSLATAALPAQLNQETIARALLHNFRNAVLRGNLIVVREFLNCGFMPAAGDGTLHAAVISGKMDMLDLILPFTQNDINQLDDQGNAPLHLCQSMPMAQALIKSGANPALRNRNNFLPHEIIRDKDVAQHLKNLLRQTKSPRKKSKASSVQWKDRFRNEIIKIDDLKPADLRSGGNFDIDFFGNKYRVSNRFMKTFARKLGFSTNIFNYFDPEEVFNRVHERNPDIKLRVTFDELESCVLGVTEESKTILPADIACDIFANDKRLTDLAYTDGVFKAKFDLDLGFEIFNDSPYSEWLELDYPVDGIANPTIYPGFYRQVCENGAVVRVTGYSSDIVVNDNTGIHLSRLLQSFNNQDVFNEIKHRLQLAQNTTASVRELAAIEKIINDHVSSKEIASDLIGHLEELSGDPCGLYGITSINNIADNRRHLLPVKCPVSELIAFTTELVTHHPEYISDMDAFSSNKIDAFIGHTLASPFDLEGIELWKNPAHEKMLDHFAFKVLALSA